MKAIGLTVHTMDLNLADRTEPTIAAPAEVKVRVIRAGIYGTDREITSGRHVCVPSKGMDLIRGVRAGYCG